MRTAGAEVAHTFVIFYYDIFTDTPDRLAEVGIKLHYLATWWDVLAACKESGRFDTATLSAASRTDVGLTPGLRSSVSSAYGFSSASSHAAALRTAIARDARAALIMLSMMPLRLAKTRRAAQRQALFELYIGYSGPCVRRRWRGGLARDFPVEDDIVFTKSTLETFKTVQHTLERIGKGAVDLRTQRERKPPPGWRCRAARR